MQKENQMTIWGEYINCLKKYATFSGRATRREYWSFSFINFVVLLGISVIEFWVGSPFIVSGVYLLLTLMPWLAARCRRFHDMGLSAWWAVAPYWFILALLVVATTGYVLEEFFLPKSPGCCVNCYCDFELNVVVDTFKNIRAILYVLMGSWFLLAWLEALVVLVLRGKSVPNRFGRR